jgi:hypothetical protein
MTKEELKEYHKAYYQANKEKKKAHYEANKESIKAYREANRDKIAENKKAYREANRDKLAEYDKAYRKENRDKLAEYNKEYHKAYYEDNKEQINENTRERRKTDPIFKLKLNLRRSSNNAWKGQAKTETTEKLLGCSYNDFKDYIEYQFVGNMSWNNYGDVWHIDHIIPLAVIEDVAQEELISSLCHYSNLQPLFACHNISKNDRLDYEYPAIYKTNLLHNSNKK